MHHNILGFELQDAQPGYIFEVGSLYELLQTVGDSRKPQGQRWPTAVVLLFAIVAKLAGQDSARGIANWINLRIQMLNQALDLPAYTNRQGIVSGPHATTYGRVMGQTVNRHELNVVVQGYFGSQAVVQQAEQVCLDGKTLCGTVSPEQPLGVRMLEAYQPQTGVGVAQTEIASDQFIAVDQTTAVVRQAVPSAEAVVPRFSGKPWIGLAGFPRLARCEENASP